MRVSMPQNGFLRAVLNQVTRRRTGIKHFGRLDITCYRHLDHEELRLFVEGDLRPSLEVRIWDDQIFHVLVSSTRKRTFGRKLYELHGRRLVGSAEEIAAAMKRTAGDIGLIEESPSSEAFLVEIDACWRRISVGMVE